MALKYSGPLFGKIGRKHIPLKAHSDDVDKMECDIASLRSALAEKTARVDELEALNEDWIEVNNDQCEQIDMLTEQVKILREALTNIHDYGLDRDGEHESEKLGALVDELVQLAREALAATAPKET